MMDTANSKEIRTIKCIHPDCGVLFEPRNWRDEESEMCPNCQRAEQAEVDGVILGHTLLEGVTRVELLESKDWAGRQSIQIHVFVSTCGGERKLPPIILHGRKMLFVDKRSRRGRVAI